MLLLLSSIYLCFMEQDDKRITKLSIKKKHWLEVDSVNHTLDLWVSKTNKWRYNQGGKHHQRQTKSQFWLWLAGSTVPYLQPLSLQVLVRLISLLWLVSTWNQNTLFSPCRVVSQSRLLNRTHPESACSVLSSKLWPKFGARFWTHQTPRWLKSAG